MHRPRVPYKQSVALSPPPILSIRDIFKIPFTLKARKVKQQQNGLLWSVVTCSSECSLITSPPAVSPSPVSIATLKRPFSPSILYAPWFFSSFVGLYEPRFDLRRWRLSVNTDRLASVKYNSHLLVQCESYVPSGVTLYNYQGAVVNKFLCMLSSALLLLCFVITDYPNY